MRARKGEGGRKESYWDETEKGRRRRGELLGHDKGERERRGSELGHKRGKGRGEKQLWHKREKERRGEEERGERY